MKFPDPFEAFNKSKEGFENRILEEGENDKEIANDDKKEEVKDPDAPKYTDIRNAMLMLFLPYIFFSIMIVGLAHQTGKTMSRIALTIVFSFVIMSLWTAVVYGFMFDGNHMADSRLWTTCAIVFCIFMLIPILLFHPNGNFVEIFGNSIGYMFLPISSMFISTAQVPGANDDQLGITGFTSAFNSRTFENADINMRPLINIFPYCDKSDETNFNSAFNAFATEVNKSPEQNNVATIDVYLRDNNEQSVSDQSYPVLRGNTKVLVQSKFQVGEVVWIYILSITSVLTSMSVLSTGQL